jgi:hypothetical protein
MGYWIMSDDNKSDFNSGSHAFNLVCLLFINTKRVYPLVSCSVSRSRSFHFFGKWCDLVCLLFINTKWFCF